MTLLAELLRDVGTFGPRLSDAVPGDHAIVRLTNALLLEVIAVDATHLRVIADEDGAIELWLAGRWEDALPIDVHPGVARAISARLLEMSDLEGRHRYEIGTLHLEQRASPATRPGPLDAFYAFHTLADDATITVMSRFARASIPTDDAHARAHGRTRELVGEAVEQLRAQRPAEATASLQEALERIRNGPPSHPMLKLDALEALADAWEMLGRYDNAAAQYEKQIAFARDVIGEHSVAAVFGLVGRGQMELDREDAVAAEAPIERAVESMAVIAGRPCGYLGADLERACLARVRGESGAQPMLARLAARAARFSDRFTEVRATYQLGLGAMESHDLERAASTLRRALTMFDEPQPYAARVELALAKVLSAQGREPEGFALVRHATELLAKLAPPDHPERVKAELELAQLNRGGSPYR